MKTLYDVQKELRRLAVDSRITASDGGNGRVHLWNGDADMYLPTDEAYVLLLNCSGMTHRRRSLAVWEVLLDRATDIKRAEAYAAGAFATAIAPMPKW
jgi:hypothetical protein